MRYKYRTFVFKKICITFIQRDISVEYLIPFVDCVLGEKRESFYFYAQDLQFPTKSVLTQPQKKATFNSKSSMAALETLAFTGWFCVCDCCRPRWRSKMIPFTTYSKHFCFYCAITYITRQRGQPDNEWKKDVIHLFPGNGRCSSLKWQLQSVPSFETPVLAPPRRLFS